MTDDAVSLKPDLGRFGVWTGGPVTPEQAVEIEKLGYGAMWVGGSPAGRSDVRRADPRAHRDPAGRHRHRQRLGRAGPRGRGGLPPHRGRLPRTVPARHRRRPSRAHRGVPQALRRPGRVSRRARRREGADQPPGGRRARAEGADSCPRKRSAGAHPYLTTPEHTAQARELIGNTVFLAPEHKVVLTTDAEQARAIGRKTVDFYLGLSNYVNNWKRLGFSDDDIAKPGSDKLIDAVVAHGTPDEIASAADRTPRRRRRSRGRSRCWAVGTSCARR